MGKAHQTAQSLLEPGTGILVADEYVDTMIERLMPADRTGARPSAGRYVDLVLGAPGLETWISSILLTGDTFAGLKPSRLLRRHSESVQPMAFGVRMDAGRTRVVAGDGPMEGLDDVRRELADQHAAGAVFAEWRANLSPLDVAKGDAHIDAEALARGAAVSQSQDVLPLVTIAMPDLASHSAAVTQAVTGNALAELFTQMQRFEVDTSALLLRVNMVVAGDPGSQQTTSDDVAHATLKVISNNVPTDVPGIAFLSGGQTIDTACANLSAITTLNRASQAPWRLTFAFTRALVTSSLEVWQGDSANGAAAQRELLQSCRQAGQAVSSSPEAPSSSG